MKLTNVLNFALAELSLATDYVNAHFSGAKRILLNLKIKSTVKAVNDVYAVSVVALFCYAGFSRFVFVEDNHPICGEINSCHSDVEGLAGAISFGHFTFFRHAPWTCL